MELILVILKMVSGYLLPTFLHEKCTVKAEPHDVHMVMCMSKFCCLYLNSYCVYFLLLLFFIKAFLTFTYKIEIKKKKREREDTHTHA